MTNPQDPYWSNPFTHEPFTYDPLGRVPFVEPPAQPPVFTPPPAPPQPPPVNAFATLSLVFAFVFAPVGAVLGHLGLAQIRRTGERGRERARAGVALSYAFIALTALGLVAWSALGASPSHRTAAPATATSTTAAPPAVAPDSIAALLPGVDALKNITGDQNLDAGRTWNHPARPSWVAAIDRPECWGSIAAGAPDAYTADAIAGYHATEFSDTRSLLKSQQIIQAVAAFRDPNAAQSQLAKLLAGWHQCDGLTVAVTSPGGQTIPYPVGAPADAGNGITTLDLTPKDVQVRSVRAVAAKANVVIDVYVSCSGTTDSQPARTSAVGIANYLLGKIPG